MRFATITGRLHLVLGETDDPANCSYLDLAAHDPRVPKDAAAAFDSWDTVLDAAAALSRRPDLATQYPDGRHLQAPSPRPRQVFAIGLNYRKHAGESGFAVPDYPFVFTKTESALAGPVGEVGMWGDTLDWEVEAVAVIGRRAWRVTSDQAWTHVAGIATGQDFSDRSVQNRLGPNSQPTLGKSLPGYGPTGPFLVTPDEYADRDDIGVTCRINGEIVQDGRTRDLVFDIPALIVYLSAVTPLLPGDLIFTGTPEGVGIGRTPPSYLHAGDVVETTVERAGTMRHVVVEGSQA